MTRPPLPSLVVLRILKQITQKELADVLGVTEQTIHNWERGKAVPKLTIPQTKTLCKVLGATLDELPNDFSVPMAAPFTNWSGQQENPAKKNDMTKAPSLSFVVLRSLKQITQKELADVLGVTEDTISNWERGKVVPKLTIPQTKALCNLLEVNLEQLPDNFGKPERHSYQIDNGKSPPVANIDLE